MRVLLSALVTISAAGAFAGQETPSRGTQLSQPLPPQVPPTAASLYQLLFEVGEGTPYREFVQLVPNAFVLHESAEVLEACRRLGFEASHRKANWSEVLEILGPFLAADTGRNWRLYKVENGILQQLEPGKAPTSLTDAEFLETWSHDLITIAGQVTRAPVSEQPRVRFRELKHAFGDVWQGEKVEHQFVFENVGSATLEVLGVHASCGCTAVLVGSTAEAPGKTALVRNPDARKEFPPGAAGFIQVNLNTAGKRGAAHSSVTVSTNDPAARTTRLDVSANVKVPVEVSPPSAIFGRVTRSSPLTREIRIWSPHDPAFEVLGATSSIPRIRVDLAKAEETVGTASGTYLLTASLDIEGMAFEERIDGSLVVRTTSARMPTVPIRVVATLSGDIMLNTKVLQYGRVQPNQEVLRYLILTNAGPRDVDIVEIRNPIPEISIQTEALTKGKQYRIRAVLKTGAEVRQINDGIVIVTNHPEQTEIPVSVVALPAQNR